MDELLQKFNINRSTLSRDEIETLNKWASALDKKQLTISDTKEYIDAMIKAIELELTGNETPPTTFANLVFRNRRERHMKARLQNYVLLRDFLTAPERARSYVEKQLASLKPM